MHCLPLRMSFYHSIFFSTHLSRLVCGTLSNGHSLSTHISNCSFPISPWRLLESQNTYSYTTGLCRSQLLQVIQNVQGKTFKLSAISFFYGVLIFLYCNIITPLTPTFHPPNTSMSLTPCFLSNLSPPFFF